jgi:hypothetical protein
MGAIAAATAPAAGAQRTSVGEATGGHAGGAEGAGDGNHSDGVSGRSGDDLGMNWGPIDGMRLGGGWRRRGFSGVNRAHARASWLGVAGPEWLASIFPEHLRVHGPLANDHYLYLLPSPR